MKKVAILIPCYNEELTIGKVIDDFKRTFTKDGYELDIYVYNNNSTDHTEEIAQSHGAIVRREPRQGKGNVVRTMFREIDADCYLIVDGDDTYPADDGPGLVRGVLEQGYDMVIGDRLSSTYFLENKRPFHNAGNRLVRSLINWLFHNEIKDIMTGYRAFSPLFVKTFPVLSKGFEIETEMTIHALDKNFKIMEVPVFYRDRPEGSTSKLNTFADGRRVLQTILRLFRDYRPLVFFSVCGCSFWLLAGMFMIPVLMEYFSTGQVPRFPTLIVSCITVVMGLLLWVCGIILTVINQKHRVLFELYLNMISMKLKNRIE